LHERRQIPITSAAPGLAMELASDHELRDHELRESRAAHAARPRARRRIGVHGARSPSRPHERRIDGLAMELARAPRRRIASMDISVTIGDPHHRGGAA
jgi:hypothetical protein